MDGGDSANCVCREQSECVSGERDACSGYPGESGWLSVGGCGEGVGDYGECYRFVVQLFDFNWSVMYCKAEKKIRQLQAEVEALHKNVAKLRDDLMTHASHSYPITYYYPYNTYTYPLGTAVTSVWTNVNGGITT